MTVRFNDEAIARHGFTQIMYAIRQTVLRQQRFNGFAIRRTHLNHRAELFVEQRRQTIATQRSNIRFHAAVAGKGHFRQSDHQAAV
ncbi:hypothetical protein D3C78_1507040 [compost metagenome]